MSRVSRPPQPHDNAAAPGPASAPSPAPARDSATAVLAVQDVADLEPLRRGGPRLLSDRALPGTHAPVRWVHVIETTDATGLLGGGEFVLSTVRILDSALAEGRGDEAASAFLDGIQRAGAVALAVEVLAGREPVVRVLRAAAAHRDLPVYLLTRQIRFVAVTQEAHRRIVARQLEELETDRRIHEVFTHLTLEATPVQRIVAEAGRLLGAEVAWSPDAASSSPGAEADGAVPVVVAGERAGWLRADAVAAPAGTLRSTVLERAAQAMALTLLSERSRRDQKRQAETALLYELRRSGTTDEESAWRRAHELGIGLLRREVLSDAVPTAWWPVLLRWGAAVPGVASGSTDDHRAGGAVLDALARALEQERATALAGRWGAASVAVLVPLASPGEDGPLLDRVLATLERRLGAEMSVVAGVSAPGPGLVGAAGRLDEAGMVAEAALSLGPRTSGVTAGDGDPEGSRAARPRLYHRAQDVRLRGLLAMVREDERVQLFARAELGPLLEPGRGEDLALLEQFVACGGNKSLLAQRIHLSRPALYARIARVERRLGVSLGDPESRTALHVALLVHGLGDR